MAFPFIYLSFYLIHYRPNTHEVAFHWFCETILYECIFGATYGVLIGYLGRHLIKWADRKELIDRESFLVFYFVLALFCAGTGATLGTDDLLVGFAAGVGFSNDGWFTEKTEESHVSNVIDLLLNLAYFVYLGSVIPWEQYNAPQFGLTPWRLVVIAIFVIFFRRIPIMLALKPLIPDIKTWREALFAGHFGPIGVGAIFAAILARAELETDTTEPLGVLPTNPDTENYLVVQIIWPLTTFLVITSILVHGSSIAVFTLGKRINTLTLTMSYTQANEEGPSWMNRLPRIQSTSKASMSKNKDDMVSEDSSNERLPEYAPGTLPPIGVPGNFLRRQKDEDTPIEKPRATRRRSRWESGMGPGGPISQSAITPQRRTGVTSPTESVSEFFNEKDSPSGSGESSEPPDQLEMEDAQEKREKREERSGSKKIQEPEVEAYEEGDELVVEDEEGEILAVHNVKGLSDDQKRQQILDDEKALRKETSGEHAKGKYHPHEKKTEGEVLEHTFSAGGGHPGETSKKFFKKLGDGWEGWRGRERDGEATDPSNSRSRSRSKPKPPEHKRGPAHAYQFGNTIIVEDEDGEVVKKYDLPQQPKQRRGVRGGVQDGAGHFSARPMFDRARTWVGMGGKVGETADIESPAEASGQDKKYRKQSVVDPDDDRIRFTVGTGGRRLSKADFIQQIQAMDPKARVRAVEESDVPEVVKEEVRAHAEKDIGEGHSPARARSNSKRAAEQSTISPGQEGDESDEMMPIVRRLSTNDDRPKGADGLTLVDSNNQDIPFHPVSASVQKYGGGETAAQRRRRLALARRDSDDDGTERAPPRRPGPAKTQEAQGETAAERRRRLAALGEGDEEERQDSSDSEDDGGERKPAPGHKPMPEPSPTESRRPPGVRFADSPAVSQGRVQWGEDVGRKGKR